MSEAIFSSRATDGWPVEQRANVLLDTVLPAIWAETNTVFTKNDLVSANSILDVSCGRGALGHALRDSGSNSTLVGVDTYDYASNLETPTAYHLYDAVKVGSIRNKETLDWLRNWSFDVVIAICTHPDVYNFLAQHVDALPVNVGGKIVFIAEVGLDGIEKKGFWRGVGKGYGYQIGVCTK